MKRLHLLLTVKDSAANVPKNLEARRRLEFFTNSLFMDMPSAKPVSEMLPFRYVHVLAYLQWFIFFLCSIITFSFCFCYSVFTPYYSETVLYSTSELQKENEDGISILFYLQKIFPGNASSPLYPPSQRINKRQCSELLLGSCLQISTLSWPLHCVSNHSQFERVKKQKENWVYLVNVSRSCYTKRLSCSVFGEGQGINFHLLSWVVLFRGWAWIIFYCRWMGKLSWKNWSRSIHCGCRTSRKFQWLLGASFLGFLSRADSCQDRSQILSISYLSYFLFS